MLEDLTRGFSSHDCAEMFTLTSLDITADRSHKHQLINIIDNYLYAVLSISYYTQLL